MFVLDLHPYRNVKIKSVVTLIFNINTKSILYFLNQTYVDFYYFNNRFWFI